jgi:hypothetical protein
MIRDHIGKGCQAVGSNAIEQFNSGYVGVTGEFGFWTTVQLFLPYLTPGQSLH